MTVDEQALEEEIQMGLAVIRYDAEEVWRLLDRMYDQPGAKRDHVITAMREIDERLTVLEKR